MIMHRHLGHHVFLTDSRGDRWCRHRYFGDRRRCVRSSQPRRMTHPAVCPHAVRDRNAHRHDRAHRGQGRASGSTSTSGLTAGVGVRPGPQRSAGPREFPPPPNASAMLMHEVSERGPAVDGSAFRYLVAVRRPRLAVAILDSLQGRTRPDCTGLPQGGNKRHVLLRPSHASRITSGTRGSWGTS